MFVPTKAIWLAVHRVFSDAGIRAGRSLGLKEMMQGWTQTGLRQRDLGAALDDLSRAGFIRLSTTAQGPCVELLDGSFGLLDAGGRDSLAVATLKQLRESRGLPAHLASLAQQRNEGRRRDDRDSQQKKMACAA